MFKISSWHWWLSRLVAHFCYRISVRGSAGDGKANIPILFIGSHRNGAIDGYVAGSAIGRIPSLVSVQLLRFFWLRLLFTGIPVVREKDKERYGLDAANFPSPIIAATSCLKAGTSICLLPEGSSQWEEKPLPYKGRMGVLVAKLKAAGVDFMVQPFGIFYSCPDGFRSRVSIDSSSPRIYPES